MATARCTYCIAAERYARIVEAEGADQQTARRVPVVSVRRPEEWA